MTCYYKFNGFIYLCLPGMFVEIKSFASRFGWFSNIGLYLAANPLIFSVTVYILESSILILNQFYNFTKNL